MKHFIEARTDTVAALGHKDIMSLLEKVCLILDLQGRCRVLAKPVSGVAGEDVRKKVSEIVAPAAGPFWTDEVWIEDQEAKDANKAVYQATWNLAKPEPFGQNRMFILDRRLSKDAWFGQTLEPPWPLNDHTAPIISFYSFKGGVGRTTALTALATNLARTGKKVVVIDFDLEAPGAGSILGGSARPFPSFGVVDYLLEHPVVPRGSLDISEFYHQFDDQKVIKDGVPLVVVPSGSLDAWYLEKLSRVNYEYLYRTATDQDSGDSSLHSMFKELRSKLKPDYFLVDSRAGFHDLGGLSLSGIAHLQVLFGLSADQSWAGLEIVISHLGKEEVASGRVQRNVAMVHAMASPHGPTREAETAKFKERSFQMFCDNYYDSSETSAAEWPIPDPESQDGPHYPAVITWDVKIAGYSKLGDVAEPLCEGEYRKLSELVLEKVGRSF